MRAVQIYKDNLREHILRSLFFGDKVLFIGGGIILAGFVFIVFQLVFHSFQTGPFLMVVFVVELCFLIAATLQIDHQPVYKLIPRAVTFSTGKKHYSETQLQPTTSDFRIVDNYIERKKNLIAVYEVEPFDIALLNDDDRELFYQRIKLLLHTLPGKVQIIVRKETALSGDYQKHFFSLYNNALENREGLIGNYITDLTSLLATERFLVMKYYAVFSTSLASTKEHALVQASKRLFDMGTRLSSSLAPSQISTRQLEKEELVAFCKAQLR